MKTKFRLLYIGNVLSSHGFTPTTIETLGDRFQKDIELYRASSKRNQLIRLLDMAFSIIRMRKQVDAVLIDTYSSNAFLFAWICSRIALRAKLPYVAFLHGGDLPIRFKKDRSKSSRYLTHAAKIISPSGYLDHAVKQSFKLSTSIIPNFIDIDNYPFLLREDLNDVHVLWVRSFHEMYQPALAIETIKVLRDQGINATLTMVGPDKDGSLESCKELAANYNLDDYVTFTGKLSKDDWIQKSKEFNVFLSTTSVDNTPVSVMEAMALGFPVISTKVGGIPYLFKNNEEGIMVNEQNAASLAEKISHLRSDSSKIKSISESARRKAEEWDWPVVRNKWLSLFESLK